MGLKRPKIFYGWWVVASCFSISLLSGGLAILGFTAFFEPIVEEFGWSYTQISLAASLRGVESGILAPILGLLIDRLGPRKMLFGGIVFLGLGLMLLSRTSSLGMFYGAFALIAIGTSGQSPTVTMTSVANWFRSRVGIAIGIMSCGFAFGSLLVPVVVRLIDVLGWRTALFIMGASILVTGLPLSLLVRHKPEQYGYLPDGVSDTVAVTANGAVSLAQTREVDIGLKQALTSSTFWHLTLALALPFVAISTVIVHIMPALSSIGISRSTSGLVASAVPLVSVAGRLGVGWLSDRFNKKVVACGCLALMAVGLLFLYYAFLGSVVLLVAFIILFGIGYGGNAAVRVALLSSYFGRSRFGSIFGFVMGGISIGNILGPLSAGWIYDNWRSYQWAWLGLACLILIAIIILATTPPLRTRAPATH